MFGAFEQYFKTGVLVERVEQFFHDGILHVHEAIELREIIGTKLASSNQDGIFSFHGLNRGFFSFRVRQIRKNGRRNLFLSQMANKAFCECLSRKHECGFVVTAKCRKLVHEAIRIRNETQFRFFRFFFYHGNLCPVLHKPPKHSFWQKKRKHLVDMYRVSMREDGNGSNGRLVQRNDLRAFDNALKFRVSSVISSLARKNAIRYFIAERNFKKLSHMGGNRIRDKIREPVTVERSFYGNDAGNHGGIVAKIVQKSMRVLLGTRCYKFRTG